MSTEADKLANEILNLSRNKLLVNLRFMDVALSYHQRNHSTPSAHIKHTSSSSHIAPSTQQHAIGAHLHRRLVVDDIELLKPENFFTSHTCKNSQ